MKCNEWVQTFCSDAWWPAHQFTETQLKHLINMLTCFIVYSTIEFFEKEENGAVLSIDLKRLQKTLIWSYYISFANVGENNDYIVFVRC